MDSSESLKHLAVTIMLVILAYIISFFRKKHTTITYLKVPSYIWIIIPLAILDLIFNKKNDIIIHCAFIFAAFVYITSCYFINRYKK
jgi:predicted neutral ceramidase superfamily lipid hydrolase